MKALLFPALLMLAAGPAHSADLKSELIEWAFDPCMQVAAAVGVTDMTEEQSKLGIRRADVAALMLASRDAAINQIASDMNPNASWEDRAAAYEVMLKICLGQFVE